MSKRDILEWFQTNSSSLTTGRILAIMLMGLLMATVIFITYRITYTGVAYNLKFNASNVAILLITIVIMLMISSNIVISLGMVGALSIVRFRTAVKDPRDTVFIFWSIVEGLCIGSQNNKLALVSTLMIAMVLLAFSFVMKLGHNYLLIVRGASDLSVEQVRELIKGSAPKSRVKTVNSTELSVEMIVELRLKNELDGKLVADIRSLPGVTAVNWLLESGDSVG